MQDYNIETISFQDIPDSGLSFGHALLIVLRWPSP